MSISAKINKILEESDERKRCKTCEKSKKISHFDLMRNVCKACRKEYRQQYYQDHKTTANTNHHRGVTFVKSLGKWKCYRKISNAKYQHVGYFSTEKEAVNALEKANKKNT